MASLSTQHEAHCESCGGKFCLCTSTFASSAGSAGGIRRRGSIGAVLLDRSWISQNRDFERICRPVVPGRPRFPPPSLEIDCRAMINC